MKGKKKRGATARAESKPKRKRIQMMSVSEEEDESEDEEKRDEAASAAARDESPPPPPQVSQKSLRSVLYIHSAYVSASGIYTNLKVTRLKPQKKHISSTLSLIPSCLIA